MNVIKKLTRRSAFLPSGSNKFREVAFETLPHCSIVWVLLLIICLPSIKTVLLLMTVTVAGRCQEVQGLAGWKNGKMEKWQVEKE